MPCTSPLSLVCPSQGEVCPQASCGEGSGKMPLAHCTAVPVCGGKSRGWDTKVTVADVLPTNTFHSVSKQALSPFPCLRFWRQIYSMYFLIVNVTCNWEPLVWVPQELHFGQPVLSPQLERDSAGSSLLPPPVSRAHASACWDSRWDVLKVATCFLYSNLPLEFAAQPQGNRSLFLLAGGSIWRTWKF